MELPLLLVALVPARSEVEDRIGMDVIDARSPALAEAGLAVRLRLFRIEVLLEPLDVASAPCPGLAVAPEDASLSVVGVARDVPVADVDDVEQLWVCSGEALVDRRLQEEAERAALEQLSRNMARGVLGVVGVMFLLGDEEITDSLVLEEKPALRVQKEVVLEALRDQDVPRAFVGCPSRRIGCRQLDPSPRSEKVSRFARGCQDRCASGSRRLHFQYQHRNSGRR
jgi:hypothetical protein